jgi:hypothetical protein
MATSFKGFKPEGQTFRIGQNRSNTGLGLGAKTRQQLVYLRTEPYELLPATDHRKAIMGKRRVYRRIIHRFHHP